MPSFSMYKKIHYSPSTNGEAKKRDADNIMNATWWDDITSRVGYLYDWYHDKNKTRLNDMDPAHDDYKVPIDIKFLTSSSQTYEKDSITYHLQLRPGQKCNVAYYDEFFGSRYDASFPIGLYCDIQDANGVYNRWLVVQKANFNDPQFPTFELLRCDKVIQYIFENVKYNVAGVLRSQNSYNSGLWVDYKIQTIDFVAIYRNVYRKNRAKSVNPKSMIWEYRDN